MIDPDVPARVLGDPERLRQVVMNLVANAIKFTERGGVDVSIHLLDGADTSRKAPMTLEFCVQDSGIGVPPALQDRLFRPFSQVDNSIARRHGGTGLGLAICKGLVEAMGGRIWVQSEAGVGSRFSFTMPTEASAQVSGPADTGSAFDESLAKRFPLRILLAEDLAVNQKVALAMLRRFGYEADVAGNGIEAVDAVKRQPYDLVLMDIQMPEMDGLDATRAIIALDPGRTRPTIVGLSANAMAEDVQSAKEAGMDDYLSKPISPAELRSLLEKWGGSGTRAS